MTRMLHWTSSQLTRRRFVKRVAATTFGLFAGLAAGVPEIAYAGSCGGMACAGCNCQRQQRGGLLRLRIRLRRVRKHRLPEPCAGSLHREPALLAEQRPLLLRLRLPLRFLRLQLHVPRGSVAHARTSGGSVVTAIALATAALLSAVAALAGDVGDLSLAAAIVTALVAGLFSAGST